MKLSYIVDQSFYNIKEILKAKFEISDRTLLKLKLNNKILINSNPCTNIKQQIKIGDTVEVLFDYEEDNSNIIPTKMDLNILYEDEWLLILNKQARFPIHPSMLHYEDSLSNGVRYYFDCIGLKKKIRPVNRLDKDTSGVVIFAKNEYTQEALIRQMKNGGFVKEYIAVCNRYSKRKRRYNKCRNFS